MGEVLQEGAMFFLDDVDEVCLVDRSERAPGEQAKFLVQGGNMKGKYLGACLDSCRWGSTTTVMYEMSIKGMMGFIQNWMQQNKENFDSLWHPKQNEDLYTCFELPFVHHKACPKDRNHNGVIRDLAGRVRCANKTKKSFKPSFIEHWDFFDECSGTKRREFYDDRPVNPLPDFALNSKTGELYSEFVKQYNDYLKCLKEFEEEESSLIVTDVCYAILSDRGKVMPLETVIKRLNLRPEIETVYCNKSGPCKRVHELSESERADYSLFGSCPGHNRIHDKVEFNFDGWTLALYAMKWHQQASDGSAPVFEV